MTPHEKILEALVEELRSLQELHEYEVGSEDAALAVSRARLNEILATHELVPIDDAIGLRRECLALIEEAERRAKDNGMGDVAYRNAIQRLKLFLRDSMTTFHEERDETPFDPERCGWDFVNGSWYSHGVELRKFEGTDGMRIVVEDMEGFMWNAPWPAKHSDGVRLLQLLGLEVRE